MLASQLIYTSWRNGSSPNKGYMVYSKSSDITKDESDEIVKVMKYKAPSDLPPVPTEEQIQTIFPKNFAYFQLFSGRYCVAQASYIGQDYTKRYGNYIIHAYVLDDIADLVPANMIGADIFRLCLTEEELNADKAPDSLPKVEFAPADTVPSAGEIDAFFAADPRRRDLLKKLAVIAADAVANGKRIEFTEQTEHMRYWLPLLATILPKEAMKALYFCTYVKDATDRITFSCLRPMGSSVYGQRIGMVDLVELKAIDDCSDHGAGLYLNALCDRLASGFANGTKFPGEIASLMSKYGISDRDFAVKMEKAVAGDFSMLSSFAELEQVFAACDTRLPASETGTFEIFYRAFAVSAFSKEPSASALLKKLFPHLSAETKQEILFAAAEQVFARNTRPTALCDEVAAALPCAFSIALPFFMGAEFTARLKAMATTAADVFRVRILVEGASGMQPDAGELIAIYQKAVFAGDYDLAAYFLGEYKRMSPAMAEKAYLSLAADTDLLDRLFYRKEAAVFRYLELAKGNAGRYWSFFLAVIDRYADQNAVYVKEFSARCANDPTTAKALYAYAGSDLRIGDFLAEVALYQYETSTPRDMQELLDGYRNFVLKQPAELLPRAKSSFMLKLRAFLAGCGEKDQIKKGMELYTALVPSPVTAQDKEMVQLLTDAVFGNKSLELLSKQIERPEMIRRMGVECHTLGIPVNERIELLYEGLLFTGVADKERGAREELKDTMTQGQLRCFDPKLSAGLFAEFAEKYLPKVVESLYAVVSEEYTAPNAYPVWAEPRMIDSYLTPFFRLGKEKFSNMMVDVFKRNSEQTARYLKMYICYFLNENNQNRTAWDAIVKEYLRSLSKGRRSALFVDLSETFARTLYQGKAIYKEVVDAYIKKYQGENKSFFERLFGHFGSKKEAPKDNGQNPPPQNQGQNPAQYGQNPAQYGQNPAQYGQNPAQYGQQPPMQGNTDANGQEKPKGDN